MKPGKIKIRFLLVVTLLAAPSLVFGWLFITKGQVAIAVAQREIFGVYYLRSILPLFVDLTEEDARSRPALEHFKKRRGEMDRYFQSELQSSAVINALSRPNVDPEAVRYALLALITTVSDNAKLTIDPQLDSYYLIQAMMFQVPRVMSSIDALSARMAIASAVPQELSQSANEIFLETSRLEDSLSDLRQIYKRALSANSDGSLEMKLSTKVEVAMRAIHQMSISGHRLRADILGPHDDTDQRIIPPDGGAEKRAVIAGWYTMADNLERLIHQRIDELNDDQNIALGFSGIAAVIVLFMGLGVFRSLLVELDEKIVFLAHHDAMTQLKNRAAFSSAMSAHLLKAHNGSHEFALHAIDLDGFKSVNDTFGHHVGDHVLQTIASRLLELAGPNDLVGRRGGDEFVILQNTSPAQTVDAFTQRVLKALRQPIIVEDNPISLSASVGTSLFGMHGTSEAKLMQAADMALYASKRAGKDRACVFNRAMEIEQRQKHALEFRIREAVANMEFSLAYQPQYDTTGTRITGFEALLRLDGADGRPISPVDFIPVLERLNLISDIGRWVLAKACETATGWLPHIVVAVNVSPLQFAGKQLCEDVITALSVSGLPPQRLQIEITESAVLDDTDLVLEELNDLKALGVSIAMDDFGTGYSSLSSLWRFPFDKIKIDKSFLSDKSERGAHALNTVGSIVDLAHSLSMSVTIEGVETQAQALKMAELRCDQLQGFYFSKPIAEVDLPLFILKSLEDSSASPSQFSSCRDVVGKAARS